MNEALIHSKYAVVAHLHAPKILQPGDGAFDFPATPIAAQLASILVTAQNAVTPIGDNQLDTSPFQASPHGVTVVSAVRHHAQRFHSRSASARPRHSHLGERALRQFVLRRFSARELNSQRKSLAIHHQNALRALSAHGFAHSSAPFFATIKVASRNASFQSSSCRRSISANNCCQAFRHTPCSSQDRNRSQQVLPLGYCLGNSRQGAPLRSTHKMPSQQLRVAIRGRPRPSRRRFGFGKNPSMRDHCLSVSICQQPTTMRLRPESDYVEAEPIYETSSKYFFIVLLFAGSSPAQDRGSYATGKACADCHADIVDGWKKTPHAIAYESLKNSSHIPAALRSPVPQGPCN